MIIHAVFQSNTGNDIDWSIDNTISIGAYNPTVFVPTGSGSIPAIDLKAQIKINRIWISGLPLNFCVPNEIVLLDNPFASHVFLYFNALPGSNVIEAVKEYSYPTTGEALALYFDQKGEIDLRATGALQIPTFTSTSLYGPWLDGKLYLPKWIPPYVGAIAPTNSQVHVNMEFEVPQSALSLI
jgi:hypothetical protein